MEFLRIFIDVSTVSCIIVFLAFFVAYGLTDIKDRKGANGKSKAHLLKTKEKHFNKVWNGYKQFEVRKNDRFFEANDIVILKETAGTVNGMTFYTGRKITARIEYVFDIEDCFDGLVAFSIDVIKKETGLPRFEKD